MKALWPVTLVILCGSMTSTGQAPSGGPRRLAVSHATLTPLENPRRLFGLMSRCDSLGNVYIPAVNDRRTIEALLRLSATGKDVSRYSLEAIPEFAGAEIVTFALGTDSRVHLLVRQRAPISEEHLPVEATGGGFFILSFTQDRKLVAQTSVDLQGIPKQLGTLPDGNFVLAGQAPPDENHPKGLPFVNVVDSHGHILKEIVLAGDDQPTALSVRTPGTKPRTIPLQDLVYDVIVDFSKAEVSESGTIFLARRSRQGSVFMISPVTEDVAGAIQFTPPKGTEIVAIKPSGRHVVAKFARLEMVLPREFESVEAHYFVLDPETGEAIAHYIPSPELMKTTFVCSVGQDFLFLDALTQPGRVILVRATPQ